MRYVLTFAFILGLSTLAPVQADEVGSGVRCPDCMGGFSFMTSAPLVVEDEDTSSSAAKTATAMQPARTVSSYEAMSWWTKFARMFYVE